MIRWAKQKVSSYLTQYVEREIITEINSGDYSNALGLTGKYCENRENNFRAHWFHTQALIGLSRFEEVLRIVERFEDLQTRGKITLTKEWQTAFSEAKCRALYGKYDYADLSSFAKKQHQLFPEVTAFIAYTVLAALKNGDSTDFVTFANLLWDMRDRIDASWYYEVMIAGYRWLGDDGRVAEIVHEAPKHFPEDASLKQLINNPDSLIPICPSRKLNPRS